MRRGAVVPVADETKAGFIGRSIPLPIVEETVKEFKLLDEFLGMGFALVAVCPEISIDPFTGIRATRLFQIIQPRCVIVQVASSPLYALEDTTVVRLVDDKFRPLIKSHVSKILLVRPDRYIVGQFSEKEFKEFEKSATKALQINVAAA